MKIIILKNTIFNNYLLFKILITFTMISIVFSNRLKSKIKDEPLVDDQYRQANVPPIVAVLIDMPSYGKTELYKWNDYIQANTLLIAKNRKKNEDLLDQTYSDRLNRMGRMKARIG